MTGHLAILIFEALLGVFTAYAAYSLFTWTPPSLAKAREALGMPKWFWLLAGTVATIGAAGLFVGLAIPLIGALAALWMVAYFIVATLTHVTHRDFANVAPAVILLVICAGLAALRWGDLASILPTVVG
ncbi:MAG TPA: DoxX family protein [Ktedonobacterales bacterium]|nr:DoxX family protein [Ktedonobacterales bacterium]